MLIFTFFLSLMAANNPPSHAHEVVHKFHVSYGRLAIDVQQVMCQIKFFTNDLEDALAATDKNELYKIDASAKTDSLFTVYFNSHFVLTADSVKLTATINSSGEEGDMWWYVLSFDAPQPVKVLKIKNDLLFDLFEDQKNIFKVMHFPEEKPESFYFVDGADSYTLQY